MILHILYTVYGENKVSFDLLMYFNNVKSLHLFICLGMFDYFCSFVRATHCNML